MSNTRIVDKPTMGEHIDKIKEQYRDVSDKLNNIIRITKDGDDKKELSALKKALDSDIKTPVKTVITPTNLDQTKPDDYNIRILLKLLGLFINNIDKSSPTFNNYYANILLKTDATEDLIESIYELYVLVVGALRDINDSGNKYMMYDILKIKLYFMMNYHIFEDSFSRIKYLTNEYTKPDTDPKTIVSINISKTVANSVTFSIGIIDDCLLKLYNKCIAKDVTAITFINKFFNESEQPPVKLHMAIIWLNKDVVVPHAMSAVYVSNHLSSSDMYILDILGKLNKHENPDNFLDTETYTISNIIETTDLDKKVEENIKLFFNLVVKILYIIEDIDSKVLMTYINNNIYMVWARFLENIFILPDNILFYPVKKDGRNYVTVYEDINWPDTLKNGRIAGVPVIQMSDNSESGNDYIKQLEVKVYNKSNDNGAYAGLWKSFKLSIPADNFGKVLCVRCDNIMYSELFMNYIMMEIKQKLLGSNAKNVKQLGSNAKNVKQLASNLHTHEFMYDNGKQIIMVHKRVGVKYNDSTGKYKPRPPITNLGQLLWGFYDGLLTGWRVHNSQSGLNLQFNNIMPLLIGKLKPFLELLTHLRKTYGFVHTKLKLDNILLSPIKNPNLTLSSNKPGNIRGQDCTQILSGTNFLLANYETSRISIKLDTKPFDKFFNELKLQFNPKTIDTVTVISSAPSNDLVKKQIKKHVLTDVMREECITVKQETNIAKQILYMNWDVLSLFINIIHFMKKFNAKANPHFSYNEVSIEYNSQYDSLVSVFIKHINLPKNSNTNAKAVLNKIHTNVIRKISGIFKMDKQRHTFDFVLDVFDRYIKSYDKLDIKIKVMSSKPQNKGMSRTKLANSIVQPGHIQTKKKPASNTESSSVNATKKQTLFQKLKEKLKAFRFAKTKKNTVPDTKSPSELRNPKFNASINPNPDNGLPPPKYSQKRNPRNALDIPPQEQAPRIISSTQPRQDRLAIPHPPLQAPPRPAQSAVGPSAVRPGPITKPLRPAPQPPGSKPPRPDKGPVASLNPSTSGIRSLLLAENPNSPPSAIKPPPRPTSPKPVVTAKKTNSTAQRNLSNNTKKNSISHSIAPPFVNRSTKPVEQQGVSKLIAKFEGTGK